MTDDIKPFHYKPSRKWRFWHKFTIGHPGDPYLFRLTLFKTPWFSVKIHKIFRPDAQRDLHDHPWSFLSLILRGFYEEHVPCEGCERHYDDGHYRLRKVRWWNWKRAEDTHSIRYVSRVPVWTLVFCGPERRDWGFWVNGKWVLWTEYDKLYGA